jgi:predicted component of type VI protein secretion system
VIYQHRVEVAKERRENIKNQLTLEIHCLLRWEGMEKEVHAILIHPPEPPPF